MNGDQSRQKCPPKQDYWPVHIFFLIINPEQYNRKSPEGTLFTSRDRLKYLVGYFRSTAVSDAEMGKLSLSFALLIQGARVGEGWDMIPHGTLVLH